MKNTLQSIFAFYIIILFSILLLSCSENDPIQDESNIDLDFSDLSFDGLSIDISPVKVNLKDYPLNDLLSDLADELFEIEFQSTNSARTSDSSEEIEFIEADILINGDEVLITPFSGVDKDYYKKCGGKTGDGWKSFGVCKDKECITEKMAAAAKELGEPGTGKCLDLRVIRTLLEARVCGRITNC